VLLRRNEWTLLIYYLDNVDGNSSLLQFSGSRDDAPSFSAANELMDG
jgi:hypothetical protein